MARNRRKAPQEPEEAQPNRLQRILAFMFAGVLGISIIAVIASLVLSWSGLDLTTGVWPVVLFLPTPGLAIAVILLITLLVVTAVRRSRAAKDARG